MDINALFFLMSMTLLPKASARDERSLLSTRIFNGTPTSYKEHPFFTTILVDYSPSHSSKGGGSFLTDLWIVTAAHVLNKLAKVWTTEKVFTVEVYHAGFWRSETIEVAEFRRHPLYEEGIQDPMKPDIGLIRIKKAVRGRTTRISLPSPFEETRYIDTGRPLTFIGTGGPSRETKVFTMPVTLLWYYFHGTAYRVRARSPLFLRPEQGDSGGPVFATDAARSVIIAVQNSVGRVLRQGREVAVESGFTRVTRVISWILHSMDSSPAGAAELEASMSEWMSVIVGERHLIPGPESD